jgi:hypothetical protein
LNLSVHSYCTTARHFEIGPGSGLREECAESPSQHDGLNTNIGRSLLNHPALERSKSPVAINVLKMMSPQAVIQLMTQTPVRLPKKLRSDGVAETEHAR